MGCPTHSSKQSQRVMEATSETAMRGMRHLQRRAHRVDAVIVLNRHAYNRHGNTVAKWEARLRDEGLAPLDQRVGGRVVIRTEVITPRRQLIDNPEALARALEQWCSGNRACFDSAGREMLLRMNGNRHVRGRSWPKRRARILLRLCLALCEGTGIYEAMHNPREKDLAYDYLPALSRCVLATDLPPDDDESGDDGNRD
jgi:hypothetical protein